jgi:fibronectin-binding autotransporter adhesin
VINRISAHRPQSQICKFPNKSRTVLSRRLAILEAATAWVAPLKRTAIQAAAAAWSGRARRSAVLVTAAATALVVAAGYHTPGARGDATEYYIGGNGGYWGTANNWNEDEVPSSSGTYNIVSTNVGPGSGSDNTVDLHGTSFTVGEITGTNAGDIETITNTFGSASLLIDPASMTTPTGSTIYSNIEGDTGDLLTLQIGNNDGSDSSIIAELNGFIGTGGNNDVKVILDGVEGNADFVEANNYTGGTTIEHGAMAIAETATSFGSGTITFQNSGGIIQLGSNFTSGDTIANNIKLNANATIDTNGSAAYFSGNFTGNGALTITDSSISSASFNDWVSLEGLNTYTGGTTITSSGNLAVSGSIGGAVTDNGIFILENNLSITDLNGTNSSGLIGIGYEFAHYTLTISPTAHSSDSFAGTIEDYNSAVGSVVNFNGASSSTFTLTGTLDNIGAININSGTVVVTDGGYLNADDGSDLPTTIGANGTLTVSGPASGTGIGVGGSISDNGIFNVETDDTISGLAGTGSVAISSGDTLTVDNTAIGTFAGVISGDGGLTVSGTKLFVLSGKNTYSGGTTIDSGAMLSVTGTIEGPVTDNGTFDVNNSFSITDLTGASGGYISIASGKTLTVAPTGTNNDIYAGTIGTAAGNLIVNGASGATLTLEGIDSATGTTAISGGTLDVDSGGGITVSTITINSHGTLTVGSAGYVNGSIVDNGVFNVNNTFTIGDLNGTNTTASIVIGSGDTLAVNSSGTVGSPDVFAGVISGSGGNLELTSGVLKLSGANTYAATTIDTGTTLDVTGTIVGAITDNGTLNVENNLPGITDLAGTSAAAIINITGSKTLTVAPTGTDDYEGNISGAGNLTVDGNSGTSLELDGTLSYTGTTTIGSTATLIITGADTIGGVQFGTGAGTLEVQNNVNITDLNGTNTAAQLIIDSGDILSVSPTEVDDFEGAISGGGTLTLTEGTLNLSGSVNDVTLIQDSGSTLNFTASSTIYNPSGSGNVTIASDQTLTVLQSTTTDWQANISGAGNLTINGNPTGTLTLSGTLTYTGLTTIGDGATVILTGTGDDIGGVHIDAGGTFSIDPNVTIGDLTGGGSLTIASGDILTSIPTTNDTYTGVISGAGGFTLGDSTGGQNTSLTLTNINTYGSVGGTTITNTNTLIVGVGGSIDNSSLFTINSGGTLTVAGAIANAVVDDGTFNVENSFSITDLSGTGALNISENLSGTGYTLTVTPTTADKLTGLVTDNGILAVDGTNSLTLSAAVTGSGAIVIGTGSDTPTLTLSGPDTYSGGTTINDGATLDITSTGSIVDAVTNDGTWNVQGSLPGITDLTGTYTSAEIDIFAGKTLTVAPTGVDDYEGDISGGGSLTVNGASGTSLELDGALSYTGTTTIGSSATLIITDDDSDGTDTIGSVQFSSGAGELEVQNNLNITNLNGTNSASQIAITGSASYALTITPSTAAADDFEGVISGNGNLVVDGPTGSSLTLSGTNTYNGGTTIGSTATLDVTGTIVGAVTDNGGTFSANNNISITDFNGSGTLNIGSSDNLTVTPTTGDAFSGSVSDKGTLTVGGTNSLDLSSKITGTGAVVVGTGSDTPTLTLDGKDTYSGGTTINQGATLTVSSTGSITDAVTDNGTFMVNNSFTIGDLTGTNDAASIVLGAGDVLTIDSTGDDLYAGSISGDGGLTLATGTLNLTGTGTITYTGTTTIDSGATLDVNGTLVGPVIDNGTLGVITNQTIGNLTGSGAMSISTGQFITIQEDGTSTYSGTISGGGGLTINGDTTGDLITTGTLTYTGLTTIGTGATLTLSGTGDSIGGVDVQSGGTFAISPNVSITDLTGAGTVSIGPNETLTSSPTTNDTFTGTIIGAGAFTLGTGTGGTATSLTLTGVNTYSGGTTITATNTLNVSGSITGAVTDNGTFNVQSTFGITDLTGAATGVINITTDDTLTVAPTHGSNDVYNGTITGGSGGGLTVDGTATDNSLTLAGDLSGYTGLTTIQNNGTLKIDYTDNLPSTSAFTFLSGSTTGDILDFVGSGTYTQTLGTLTLGGDDTIDADGSGNTVTFNDQIISSSASNKITLQNGTFVIGTDADLSLFTAGTVKIGNGTGTSASAVLEFSTVPNVPISGAATVEFDDGTVDYTGTGTVDLPSFITYTVDAAGGLVENTGTTPGTLEIDGNITDSTSGTLTFSGGTFELTSNNTSTLTSGTIAIGDAPAVMEIENQDAFGNAAVTVNDGSTLETSNFVAGNLTAGAFNITAASYLQDSTSTLQLEATGLSSSVSDNFALGSGAASLNGTLSLKFVNNPYDFDKYTIVNTTGTVTDNGTFNNSVTVKTIDGPVVISGNPSNAANTGWSSIVDANVTTDEMNGIYLRFWQNTVASTGQQVTIQTLFSGYAQTQNELNVAEYLDNNATPGNTSPGMQAALAALSAKSPSAISSILNEFTPTDYADLTTQEFQNSTFLDQQVFGQVANGFGGGGINTNGLSMLPTDGAAPDPFSMALQSQLQSTAESAQQGATFMDNYNSWSVGEPVPSTQQQQQQQQSQSNSDEDQGQGADQNQYPAFLNSWSAFAAGNVVVSNTPSGNPNGQTNYTTGGLLVGAGVQLDDNWSVGGFFNWGYTGANLDSLGSTQQTHSYTPGVFVGYQNDGWYADGLASYTYNSYRIDQNVMGTTATGTPTSNQYDLAVLGGYNIPVSQNFQIGPAVGLDYTHVDVSGYNETGSPFALNVGSTSADSLRTLLGGQGQYTFPGNNFPMPLDINFNAFWQHEFLNSSQGITASFSQVSSPSTFVFNSAAPERDSFLLGGGVTGHINQSISLFVNYEAQIGDNSLFGQSVMAGLAISFK